MALSLGLCDVAFQIRLGLWFSEEDYRGEVPLSIRYTKGTYYQCDLSLMILTLKTGLKYHLPGFSILKLLSSLPFFPCSTF